jgi:hypothetical protein
MSLTHEESKKRRIPSIYSPRRSERRYGVWTASGQGPTRSSTPATEFGTARRWRRPAAGGSSATGRESRGAPCARAHATGSGRAQPSSGMSAVRLWRLAAAAGPGCATRLAAADGPGCSPSRAVEEGPAVRGGVMPPKRPRCRRRVAPCAPPAQRRQAAQVERDPRDALGGPPWPTAIALPRSSPAAVSRSESETASAAGRIGGVAPATPEAGQRAARISGPIDAGEPCVGVVMEDGDGSLGAGSGERCGGAPLRIESLPQGAVRALRRPKRRCYPPAAFTSAAHAFSPASPYGLLLARARFRRFSRHQQW